ncbi:MAG: hypothetical protein IJ880_02530 [Bacilli bacterium]|nr:hypothetical protein [Bacilli bacterium]
MAFKRNNGDEKITYKVGDIDEVVDSKNNSVIMLRTVAWGENGTERLELRRWKVDINQEIALKGVAFLTEDGPHNLVNVLLEKGFGKTDEVLSTLSTRDDFEEFLENLNKPKSSKKSSRYADPKEIL